MNDQTQTDTDQTDTDQTDTDTDQTDNEAQDSAKDGNEADVPGLTLDPDDDKKSLEVDTNVRLDNKDKHLDDVPEDELLKEREERLDPDNRPENVEVDNSQRTFDPETGLFEDSDVEPAEDAPYATTEAEQSNTKKEPKEPADAADAQEDGQSEDAEDAQATDESKDTES